MAITIRTSGNLINWIEVRQRVELASAALEGEADTDPAQQQRILRERAAVLAKPEAVNITPASESVRMLEFMIGGERYGIEAAYVQQVYPMLPITALPGVPNHLVGIIAPEGEVLSVIDLRSLLGLPLAGLNEPAAIIVLSDETMEFGVLAEQILGVEAHAPQLIESEVPVSGGTDRGYLKGISPSRAGIIDARKLLNDPRLVIDIG